MGMLLRVLCAKDKYLLPLLVLDAVTLELLDVLLIKPSKMQNHILLLLVHAAHYLALSVLSVACLCHKVPLAL